MSQALPLDSPLRKTHPDSMRSPGVLFEERVA